MSEKRVVLLGPEVLAQSKIVRTLHKIVKSQLSIEDFFIVYQRVMNGKRLPGDVVHLARKLITIFGSDGASLLWHLGSPNKDSMMFRLILQEREGVFASYEKLLSQYAKRLEKRRIEAEIFNAIQSLVDDGQPLQEALNKVAGHGIAKGKGAATIRKTWLKLNREIKAGEPRLRPLRGLHVGLAEVIPPGSPPKKTGRPKKR